MWLWIKIKIAEAMVGIGVDWPNINDGDKLNAAISAGIGLVGIGLGVIGFILSRRQAKIAETLFKIEQDQLARKSNLRLDAYEETDGVPKNVVKYSVVARNKGSKMADKVRWSIGIRSRDEKYVSVYLSEPSSPW